MTKKLTKTKLKEFEKELIDWKESLLSEAQSSIEDLAQTQENHADISDQASAETDRNFSLRIRDRERKLIVKINEALERIKDASFGVCELCGELIGEKRLKARPVTTQCIECKTEMEEQERREAI
ncbi:MAG: RNA polymerase-binding protein DksA [Bdellovibrionales bacterium]|nr:RNA polymerase-binding protein DksA [Bdellovibrionales bacterium]